EFDLTGIKDYIMRAGMVPYPLEFDSGSDLAILINESQRLHSLLYLGIDSIQPGLNEIIEEPIK
ncbi:MAG: hypothetical protein RR139_12535, partial [Lachnospiraceae bacterium]